MQLLPLLLAALLGAAALVYVLYPLHRRNVVKTRIAAPLAVDEPELATTEREQTARIALQEVELDYQLGNLAGPDYRSLRERYVRRATLEMKSRHDRDQEIEELIEERLRKMRENDGNPTGEA